MKTFAEVQEMMKLEAAAKEGAPSPTAKKVAKPNNGICRKCGTYCFGDCGSYSY